MIIPILILFGIISITIAIPVQFGFQAAGGQTVMAGTYQDYTNFGTFYAPPGPKLIIHPRLKKWWKPSVSVGGGGGRGVAVYGV